MLVLESKDISKKIIGEKMTPKNICVDANTVFIIPADDFYRGSRRTIKYTRSTPAVDRSEELMTILKSRPITGQYSRSDEFVTVYEAWADQVRKLINLIEADK